MTFSEAAMIMMSGGGSADPVIHPLTVTKNGEYNAPAGIDGFNPVVVNVPVGDSPTLGDFVSLPTQSTLEYGRFKNEYKLLYMPQNVVGLHQSTVYRPGFYQPEVTFSRYLYSVVCVVNKNDTPYYAFSGFIPLDEYFKYYSEYVDNMPELKYLFQKNEIKKVEFVSLTARNLYSSGSADYNYNYEVVRTTYNSDGSIKKEENLSGTATAGMGISSQSNGGPVFATNLSRDDLAKIMLESAMDWYNHNGK